MMILHDILNAQDAKRYSVIAGTKTHNCLRHIVVDGDVRCGDMDMVKKIISHPELLPFFVADAKIEVPIAGTINGRFISRRIDRMVVNNSAKTVAILDYKTDVHPDAHRASYVAQLREYVQLIRVVYSGYNVSAYILWTHDFLLEKILSNSL